MSVWKGGLWRSQFKGGNGDGGGSQPAGPRQYLTFDRVDDCVDVSGSAASISGLEQFTVEAVVWIDESFDDETEKGEIFAASEQGVGSPGVQLRVNGEGGGAVFGYEPQGMSFITAFSINGTPTTFPRKEWIHFAGTLDVTAGEMSLYLNGQLVATRTLDAAGGFQTFQQAAIGNRISLNDRFFEGKIARVSLWDRALPAAELAALAEAPPDAAAPGLLHYWELDTGTDNIPDLVGSADGVVLGNAQWEVPTVLGYG